MENESSAKSIESNDLPCSDVSKRHQTTELQNEIPAKLRKFEDSSERDLLSGNFILSPMLINLLC